MGPSVSPPSLEALGAPPAVVAALNRLHAELARAAGDKLVGLLLYGGLARGRYHPGKSDINLVVVLSDLSAGTLTAVAGPLRTAWRAVRVEPLLLTPAEVPALAEVFPTKFLDIRDHHVVLAGSNPFAGLDVSREQIRLRIEQALRNQLLRLRRRFLSVVGDPQGQADALIEACRPLALELGALLHLTGRPVPEVDRSALLLDAAARAFDLDHEALARVAELRAGAAPEADLADLYQRVLQALARAADVVARLKETRS